MLIMTLSLKLKQDQFCEYKANFVTKCVKNIILFTTLEYDSSDWSYYIFHFIFKQFLGKIHSMLDYFPQFIAYVGSAKKQKEHERRFSKGIYQESPAYDWVSLKRAFKV